MRCFLVQNRLASTRTEMAVKACPAAGPTLKPRAALGEIGNIAVKEGQKRVSTFNFRYYSSTNHYLTSVRPKQSPCCSL